MPKTRIEEIAIKAIRGYEQKHGLPFDEMPDIFAYYGHDATLDLSGWGPVVSDRTLFKVAEVCQEYRTASEILLKLHPDRAQELIKPALRRLLVPRNNGVTNSGLKALCYTCKTLEDVDISRNPMITDVGIRELAMVYKGLRVLNLNGNPDLTGEGLAVVGECCPFLKELRISRCRQIGGWVLGRVWSGCKHLEIVDLSYLPQLRDQHMKELAKGCPNIRWLNLEDSQQVSDVGVLSMSHGCSSLEYLNLGRTNLHFKVTDVSLLALSERCPMLQELRMANCSSITDVGIHWLTRGCKAIRILSLENCTKIGNPALRALSEGCRQLQVLSIKNAKLCTDVGIRHLGEGCKELTSLDISGLYLLSDGQKRDFGAEGLQALAVTCIKLKTLALNGCFRVARVALRAVGKGLADLECLAMARCKSINETAFVDMTRGCSRITHVDLTDCDTCVTDKVIIGLAQNCKNLRSLLLVCCPKVGSPAIKALAKYSRHLETLDLTGCVEMTDESIMPLTESIDESTLKHLYLVDCKKVTDTGLSWLADGCHALLTLSVKGSSITRRSLEAVRGVWSWSMLISDADRLGIFPMDRLRDRHFIEHNARRFRAAVKIQSLARARAAHIEVGKMLRAKRRHDAITTLQSIGRMFVVCRKYKRLRALRKYRDAVTMVIQCMYRCWRARKRAKARRREVFMSMRDRVATEIQRVWRGLLGRRRALLVKAGQSDMRRRRRAAAIIIQKSYRGHRGRRRFKNIWNQRQRWLKRRLAAASLIQRVLRGFLARRRVRRIKLERKRRAALQLWASIRIQTLVRGHLARVRVRARRRKDQARTIVALFLQKLYRGYKAREAWLTALEEIKMEREDHAILTIQRYWRGAIAYRHMGCLRRIKAALDATKATSAVVVQRLYRGFQGRQRVKSIKDERQRWKETAAGLETWSATRIQTMCRCWKARGRVKAMLHERHIRWKELTDKETQRKFYYNKITGEVRWRTPQDVLDLLPRPMCSDCNYFEAAIECATCQEFFCNTCWAKVHGGGKRSSHEFRVLYDYNQKRIDYGDGEFPSKWPADIEQDEKNGWSVRVYPKRQPVALLPGSWEEYTDENTQNRSMYYNRITGESTYAPPQQATQGPLEYTTSPPSALTYVAETTQQGALEYAYPESAMTSYSSPTAWLKLFDQTTGYPYWYNSVTYESTYDRPDGYVTPRGGDDGAYPLLQNGEWANASLASSMGTSMSYDQATWTSGQWS